METERQQLLRVAFGAAAILAGVVAQVIVIVIGIGQENDSAGGVASVFFAAIPLTVSLAILRGGECEVAPMGGG